MMPRDSVPQVRYFPSPGDFVAAAVEEVVEQAARCIGQRGVFSLVLAGGSTPRPLYEALAQPDTASRIDWSRVGVFFGDERAVPPWHAFSNYRMARESLLEKVPVPPDSVFRIKGELGAAAAAHHYEQSLKSTVRLKDGKPSFDLVLLGMGPDGHTASLFPAGQALQERRRWAVEVSEAATAPFVPRITLTLPVLQATAKVLFCVTLDEEKRCVLEKILCGEGRDLPAGMVRADQVAWLIVGLEDAPLVRIRSR